MVSTQVLKKFLLFRNLDANQLTKVAQICHERVLDKGAVCFSQGKPATALHLCRSGKVDIIVQLREPWGIEVTVHTAEAGEIYGWSTLVSPRIYTASAKCAEKTEDIYINGLDLVNLFTAEPRMGYLVMWDLSAVISSRLTETRQKLAIEIANTKRKEW